MARLEQLSVTLPVEVAELVRSAVTEGDYGSTSEVVRDALDEWARQRRDGPDDIAWLREAIRIGDESGPSIP